MEQSMFNGGYLSLLILRMCAQFVDLTLSLMI
jgi:hypothetical protein